MTSASACNLPPHGFCWRRLFQFRLYALLIVTAILAFWMAWWSHTARRQREAVAALRAAGAEVVYDYEWHNLKEPPYWPAWLVNAIGADYFAKVHYVGDADRRVTDLELKHLKKLTGIRELNLEYGKISDAGLEHLGDLKSLEVLHIGGTQITDAGVEHLKGLTTLQVLSVDCTSVTDSALEQLKGLTSLRWLHLGGTRVTDEAEAQFRKSLPHCQIHH